MRARRLRLGGVRLRLARRAARRGLAEHAAGCWYERGRSHLEQAQRRVEAVAKASAAAVAKADAELAKVRAEAAAQLAQLRVEVTVEAATAKRESAAQLRRLQQAEVALGSAAALKRFRASATAGASPAIFSVVVTVMLCGAMVHECRPDCGSKYMAPPSVSCSKYWPRRPGSHAKTWT